ncbi:MAG TPA: hypothetical protein VIE89_16935 [Candidatus Binatia bacterium]|jgi:hypothetical protein
MGYKKQVREGEGEEGLMLAVLDNAIECFQKYVLGQREREKRLFQAPAQSKRTQEP